MYPVFTPLLVEFMYPVFTPLLVEFMYPVFTPLLVEFMYPVFTPLLVEFMYPVFTRMPGESNSRRFKSLCACGVFQPLVCWCYTSALGIILFQMTVHSGLMNLNI